MIESVSRAVSENEYITYAEYSNGAILLTDYSYSYYTTQNESYTSAGGTYASIDIIAACSGGDSFYSYFELENFCYTLISGNYDRIDSIGSTYCSNRCSIYRSYTPIMNESASGYAQVKYDLRFQVGPTTYYSHYTNLTILVGSNGLKISHVLEV